jgi:murein L,D-transpeptidase YafK
MIFQLKRFPISGSADVFANAWCVIGSLFLLFLLLPPASRAESSLYALYKADSVLIKKSERKLYLLKDGEPFRDYQIALGKDPEGAKLFEGDNRTPEGDYVLDWRNSDSDFYKSIHISYPNEDDAAFARVVGSYAGGDIMIHGVPNDPESEYPEWIWVEFDWTDGCIAVSNEDMDEIWNSVDEGTPIKILP